MTAGTGPGVSISGKRGKWFQISVFGCSDAQKGHPAIGSPTSSLSVFHEESSVFLYICLSVSLVKCWHTCVQ